MSEHGDIAHVIVGVGGVWKASHITEVMSAIDGLCSRVGVALGIADLFSEHDYVISNLRALGLLEKGAPETWGKAATPTDIIARKDYVDFVSLLRNNGVAVRMGQLGLEFSLTVDDLIDLVPTAARPEVERIEMSSPGEWLLLLTGVLATRQCVGFIERIFDAIVFPKEAKAEKKAAVRTKRARARKEEAEAQQKEAEAELARLAVERERASVSLDHTVAVDGIGATMRNAGLPNSEAKLVVERINHEIDVLIRHAHAGRIRHLSAKPEK